MTTKMHHNALIILSHNPRNDGIVYVSAGQLDFLVEGGFIQSVNDRAWQLTPLGVVALREDWNDAVFQGSMVPRSTSAVEWVEVVRRQSFDSEGWGTFNHLELGVRCTYEVEFGVPKLCKWSYLDGPNAGKEQNPMDLQSQWRAACDKAFLVAWTNKE